MARARLVVAIALALASCRSAEVKPDAAAPPPSAPPSVSAPAPPPPPNAIDEAFLGYRKKMPSGGRLSGNGVGTHCLNGQHVSYGTLSTASSTLPLHGDADLVLLAPWLRDPDECIRAIAIDALLPKIGDPIEHHVVPDMNDLEHWLNHEILVSLVRYLGAKGVAYDPKIFDGLMLNVTEEDFARVMRGRWEEDVDPKWTNFQYVVELDEALHVTHRRTRPDPTTFDGTFTSPIESVRVNERRQWVVSAGPSSESRPGYQDPRPGPAQTYSFWPVAPDVVWLGRGEPASWYKLRRKAG